MKKSLLLTTIVSLSLVGCGQTPTENNTPSRSTNIPVENTKNNSEGAPIEVVTSFYPLYFMTQSIMGSSTNVINLAGAVDVHDYEPSPQDLVKLNDADLVVYLGAELEPWTEGMIDELANKGVTTLEVTKNLELAEFEGHDEHEEDGHEDEHEGEEHEEDHEDEAHEEEDEHDEHGHGEYDPHTWLDPVLAQSMIDEIITALVQVNPDQTETYTANAETLKNRFADLDQAWSKSFTQCENNEVIVAHDAYGYLARRYDIEMHSIAGLSTNDEPSAKVLAELKEEAQEGITHILVEGNNTQRFANTLAAETGLSPLPINPLGRGTLDENKDFFDVMEMNRQSLATALNCQS